MRGTPANVADVVAAARRNGVDVTPQVFAAARDVLVPTYNDDYRACDVPMYCYDFSMKMRDDLRARFPGATAEVVELRADDASNGVNHYVVRANFGQGPVIFDATADQFELLADRPRIGPQLRSEADYMRFIQARGYGRPQVVD